MTINWASHRGINRPASLEAIENQPSLCSQRPFPLSHCQCAAIEGDVSIVASIVCLFNRQRPSTIFWRIRTIVIDAFQRMTRRWTSPHIREKIQERLQPSIAHTNTASTIAGKVLVGGVITSFLDGNPHVVLGSRPIGVCLTMNGFRPAIVFSSKSH